MPDTYAVGVKSWRAWRATNIGEGETLQSASGVSFDTSIGSITIDGEILWECVKCHNWGLDKKYEIDWPLPEDLTNAQLAYTLPENIALRDQIMVGVRIKVSTGAAQPAWNNTVGDKTQDENITWVTRSTRVTDPKCPNSAEIVLHQSKVYATGSNIEINADGQDSAGHDLSIDSVEEADIVRFSATSDPFDWSKEDDAGFLATGVQAAGSEVARALGKWNNQLVVLMEDNIQIWAVDPDPQRNALTQIIGDIGTSVSESVVNIGTDLLFLGPSGFRSLGQQKDELILHDTDVGSPVDEAIIKAVQALSLSQEDPIEIVATPYASLSHMWCAIGKDIWSWSWSRNSKVNAWARFTIPETVQYFAPLANSLYMRGDTGKLMVADTVNKVDYNGNFKVRAEWAFQSLNSLGVMKQIQGVDAVLRGSAKLNFKFDAKYPDNETLPVTMSGNSRSGGLMPVEIMATEVAPILSYEGADDLQIDALTLYYNNAGIV